MSTRSGRRIAVVLAPVALVTAAAAASAGSSAAPATSAGSRAQGTQLISRSYTGGIPNGPSTHAVISGDRRWARVIAYQSDASNIVRGDLNRTTDVFAVRRAGNFSNTGSRWFRGKTILVSRGLAGLPANGPSFAPAVDGSFKRAPSCVAFLSAASNLARGDTNGVVDAFVSRRIGRAPRRVSLLPHNRQATLSTTRVAVSGDCSRIAFVNGGKLYVRIRGRRTKRIKAPGVANDPSFSTGKRNDLVFAAKRGVYLSRGGTHRAHRIARGGRNPAYNDIKRHVVTYEVRRHGTTQIAYKDLGHRAHIISASSHAGDGDSRDPVIGNSGYYVTFESDATNLWTNASRAKDDHNGNPDVYLYTNVRHLTIVQSTRDKGTPLPGGGQNPSMSFYANYILFDSSDGQQSGPHQVYMRWLGAV